MPKNVLEFALLTAVSVVVSRMLGTGQEALTTKIAALEERVAILEAKSSDAPLFDEVSHMQMKGGVGKFINFAAGRGAGAINQGDGSIEAGKSGIIINGGGSAADSINEGHILLKTKKANLVFGGGDDGQWSAEPKLGSEAVGFSDILSRFNRDTFTAGKAAGAINQGAHSVAVGQWAGEDNQKLKAVAIGLLAGQKQQRHGSVAIGSYAGQKLQEGQAVAIGFQSGLEGQGANAVAIGHSAAIKNQQTEAIAVGDDAGGYDQGAAAVAIGKNSAYRSQGAEAIAIGFHAGYKDQATLAVAMGRTAGNQQQGEGAVAVGMGAGYRNQGQKSVAIGYEAALEKQGVGAIAIGYMAGHKDQGTKGIIINGAGVAANNINEGHILFKTSKANLVFGGGDDGQWSAEPKLGSEAVDFSGILRRLGKVQEVLDSLESRLGRSYSVETKKGENGYCTPWGANGDLCKDSVAELGATCDDLDAHGYMNNCDQTCAEDRCNNDSACKGFTERGGKFKLKSQINDVKAAASSACYRKTK